MHEMRQPREEERYNPERESSGDEERCQRVPLAVAFREAVRAEHQGQEWTYQCDGPCEGRQETASPRVQKRYGSEGYAEECEDSCRDFALVHRRSFPRTRPFMQILSTATSREETRRRYSPRVQPAISAGPVRCPLSHRPRPVRRKRQPEALQGLRPDCVRLAPCTD
jgi:hypothetical protein